VPFARARGPAGQDLLAYLAKARDQRQVRFSVAPELFRAAVDLGLNDRH
jgi:hypothetical protein